MRAMIWIAALSFLGWGCSSNKNNGASRGAAAVTEGVVNISVIDKQYQGYSKATFAGGCFWCTEAVFERVKGVKAVYSGYTGGEVPDPSYELVCTGATGHAEAVRIYYDSAEVSYRTLLEVFFATHDPTQLNRQGPDVGTQYRSVVFFHNKDQKKQAADYIKELNAAGKYDQPIVTQLKPDQVFYKAEDYHQDYYQHHPDQPYILRVTRPKVEKFEKDFNALLKDEYRA